MIYETGKPQLYFPSTASAHNAGHCETDSSWQSSQSMTRWPGKSAMKNKKYHVSIFTVGGHLLTVCWGKCCCVFVAFCFQAPQKAGGIRQCWEKRWEKKNCDLVDAAVTDLIGACARCCTLPSHGVIGADGMQRVLFAPAHCCTQHRHPQLHAEPHLALPRARAINHQRNETSRLQNFISNCIFWEGKRKRSLRRCQAQGCWSLRTWTQSIFLIRADYSIDFHWSPHWSTHCASLWRLIKMRSL